ncbi:hypothetical protein PQ459_12760 [Chryseobacterium sp. KACC 21268]|nr:hypothetical protein PQ459_12760 [Chryseobacterium sp. KACC 21268]
MHEERLFKYKFIYFVAIVFCIGWIIFFGLSVGNILFKGYMLLDQYLAYSIPFYFFLFSIFIFFILTLINIFKESRRTFLFLNISIGLLISFQLFNLIFIKKTFLQNLYPFLWRNLIIVGLGFLINYYRFNPKKNEIEEIGKL